MAHSGLQLTFEAECKTCGIQFTVPIDRFSDKDYVNWIVASLCLQYTKEGLEHVIDTTSQDFYKNMKNYIHAAKSCGQCDLSVIGSRTSSTLGMCPLKVCDTFKRTIEQHTTSRIDWKCAPWKTITSAATLAAIYLPTFLMSTYKSPAKADLSALLNLMEWCVPFKKNIDDMQRVKQVRNSRNDIMHSGTMRIDTRELNRHLENCIDLLEDKGQLLREPTCKEAIEKIEKVRGARVQMKLLKELEKSALQQIDVSENLILDKLRLKLRSTGCTSEEMKKHKKEIKELEERQVKLKVLHEFYNLETTDVDRRKTQCTKMYEESDRKIERQIRQEYEAQIRDLHNRLDDETNKAAKLQELLKDSSNKHEQYVCTCGKVQTGNTITIEESAPYFSTQLESQTEKETGTVILKCQLSKPNIIVQWKKADQQVISDDRIIITADNYTHQLTIRDLRLEDAGNFRCICDNVSTECRLNVEESAPYFSTQLENQTEKETGTVILTCQLSKPNIIVQWKKADQQVISDDRIIITADNYTHQLTIRDLRLEDAGNFLCICGNVSTECSLNVEESVPYFSTELENQTEKETGTVILKCQLSKPNIIVQWKKADQQVISDDRIIITADNYTHQLTIRDLRLEDAGNFRCICGNVSTECRLNVEESAPYFSTQLESQTEKETGTVILKCQLSKPNIIVQWKKADQQVISDDRIIITADNYTHQLTIRDLRLEDAGNFLCICGNVSTECRLNVEESAPYFSTQLENQTEKETGTVILKCQLSKPNIIVQWKKADQQVISDDRIIITADNYTHQLTIRDLRLEDAGNFRCICGNVSTECSLNVEESAPYFSTQLENQTEKETGTVILKCQLSKPNIIVQWKKADQQVISDDRIIITADNYTHQLTIRDLRIEDAGNFRCICGNVSTECILDVEESAPYFSTQLESQTEKETGTVILKCQLSKPNIIVQWKKADQQVISDDRIIITADNYTNQLTIRDLRLEDAGNFRCICGNVSTECILDVEEIALEFTKKLEHHTTIETNTVTLECHLSKPNKKARWMKTGQLVIPDARIIITTDKYIHKLVIRDVALDDTGDYQCSFDNVSTECTLKVKFKPKLSEEFLKPLENTHSLLHGSAILSCEHNRPNMKLTWLRDGKAVTGNNNLKIVSGIYIHQLVISNLTHSDAGKYTCTSGQVSTTAFLTVTDSRPKKQGMLQKLFNRRSRESDDGDLTAPELVLSGYAAEDVRKAVHEKKPDLQKLTLCGVNLSSLGDQLSGVFTLHRLVQLDLRDITLSHEQHQLLGRDLRGLPQLSDITLHRLSCTTHGVKNGCIELDLGGPLRLYDIILVELPFKQIKFNPELMLRCEIELPDNVYIQVSALENLLAARNLQNFMCERVSNAAVSKLVDVLPQLCSLQRLGLRNIDFSSVTDIRLSANMCHLECVELLACEFDYAGLECLLHQHNLPQRGVMIRMADVTIRGKGDLIRKIMQSPDTDVKVVSDVRYSEEEEYWLVGFILFYTQT